MNVNEARNVIGWYKTFQPMTAQTKGDVTPKMVTELVKKIYTNFDLPFLAMAEADNEDVDQLSADIGLSNEQIDYFKLNLTAQLKLSALMAKQ